MSGDKKFEELYEEATKNALTKLQQNGAIGLTLGESAILQLGVVCGIHAAIKRTDEEEKTPRQQLQPDHFAE